MADHHPEPQTTASLFGRHHFLIRRLHSLSGIVPVGAFLCVHLLTNSTVLVSSDGSEFQKSVERIHALGPLLVPVEIAFIFIPLLFHAVVGVMIGMTAAPNAQQYPYARNFRYTLQRISGYVAFVFIMYHVWHLHWFGAKVGGGAFELHDHATGAPSAAVTTATAIQSAWWIAPAYFIGILASVYHLANGIWTALITWGITIKPRSQQVAGYVCAAFGVVLMVVGIGALSGFKTFDVEKAQVQQSSHAAAEH